MYIAVDLGGTKTLVVLFDQNKEIINQIKFETPKDYSKFKDTLLASRDQLTNQRSFKKGAVGTRGILDREHGVMATDTILPWHNASIVKDCEQVFGCEFIIENDSKLAGLSEARGAGKDYAKVLYITISTGIGSAFIVNGQLDKNTEDSEIGKWLLNINDTSKTWESFASGKWITETYGMRASDLEDETAWQQISENLAIGFVDAIAAFDPDLIIIGGGVGTHFDKYGDKLKNSIKKILPEGLNMPKIIKAAHPEEAVIYGCYELIKG